MGSVDTHFRLDERVVATQADHSVAGVLGDIVARMVGDAGVERASQRTCFHCHTPPQISLPEYIARIQKYVQCSHEAFVLSLIYIDRLLARNSGLVLNHLNVHKVVFTSILLAVKFHDDDYQSNKQYSRIAGISLAELNKIEVEFLKMVDWRIEVSLYEYMDYHTHRFLAHDCSDVAYAVRGTTQIVDNIRYPSAKDGGNQKRQKLSEPHSCSDAAVNLTGCLHVWSARPIVAL